MGPDAIIDLFAEVCAPASDLGAAQARALRLGWAPCKLGRNNGVGKLLNIGKAATADQDMAFTTLCRGVGAKELILIFVRAAMGNVWVNGCRLYGYDLRSAPTREAISQRIKREPNLVEVNLGVTELTWEPGWGDGDDSLELALGPAQSEMTTVTGFSGWALVGQAVSPLSEPEGRQIGLVIDE